MTKTPLVIRSPEDAIAAVPYLLGFHPTQSMVVIGYEGPHDTCAMRLDLPQPDPDDIADRVAGMLTQNDFRRAILLGYGPDETARPTLEATRATLIASGISVTESIRVQNNRWWPLTCDDPACCPPEGRPYDITTTTVAAQATLAGQVALPDRSQLALSLAPVTGPARQAIRRATDRAEDRFLAWPREGLTPAQIQARLSTEGITLLRTLRTHNKPPTDDEIAWLGILMTSLRVRDEAWVHLNQDDPRQDIDFWSDIVRRIEEPYAAPPACILALAAYSAGDGGLANIALDRADDADPTYTLAILLRDVIRAGVPPTDIRLRTTPEQLAATYEDPE
jgi:hypothetical protein